MAEVYKALRVKWKPFSLGPAKLPVQASIAELSAGHGVLPHIEEETSMGRWLVKVGRAAVMATTVFAIGHEAQAQQHIDYPWCTSGAMQEYGAVNCGFSTLEQCLATARGNGQSCGPNPFYQSPAARAKATNTRSR